MVKSVWVKFCKCFQKTLDKRRTIGYNIGIPINHTRSIPMDFYSVKDLRTQKNVWTSLAANGEVVITNNGKPSALMLDISGGDFESFIRAVRQARAMIAFNNMRRVAAENGYMTEEEIEAEIAAARAERRQKANG